MSICGIARITDRHRSWSGLLLCAMLAACEKPDFDQSYAERERQLAEEAAAMDEELEQRLTEKPWPGREEGADPVP